MPRESSTTATCLAALDNPIPWPAAKKYALAINTARYSHPPTLPSPHFTRVAVRQPLHITAPKPNAKLPTATVRSENGGRYAGMRISPAAAKA